VFTRSVVKTFDGRNVRKLLFVGERMPARLDGNLLRETDHDLRTLGFMQGFPCVVGRATVPNNSKRDTKAGSILKSIS
jgi:hypothetical protein